MVLILSFFLFPGDLRQLIAKVSRGRTSIHFPFSTNEDAKVTVVRDTSDTSHFTTSISSITTIE